MDATPADVSVAASATAPTMLARDQSSVHFKPRGSNQIGMRQYNERVVLHAIRLHGSLPKADLARLTHLSTQTVSLIIDRLHSDGLVIKQAAVRGKVGQPSVPMALNPDGAFSIGIKIGRRNCDTLLLDFTGQVRERASLSYDFPDPRVLFTHLQAQLTSISARLGASLAERIAGVGIAAPLSLGGWHSLLGVSAERTHAWDTIDMAAQVQAMTNVPVQLVKDTAAACVAELVAGRGRSVKSFVYLFIDTFIGGGVVIDSQWRSGLRGNAGAIGSMPLHAAGLSGQTSSDVLSNPSSTLSSEAATGASHGASHAATVGTAPPAQVLSVASLYQLEQRFAAAGLDPSACYDDRALTGDFAPHTHAWLYEAASAIALVVQNAACVLDMDAVIIDGSLGRRLLSALRQTLATALQAYSWEGISQPEVLLGAIGADARAMGGALLPLYSSFAPDRELFLKLDRV
jgi:predicted NBD/HSP70 family sugar kinase